jgi:uracil-DNA glycosylase family 4
MLPKPPGCSSCVLANNGCGYSVVTGSGRIPLLVLAEAPGDWEEREGRPLVEWAPSGSIFERALTERGIKREDIIVSNVLRCRPSKTNELRGQPYERAALDHCRQYLDDTIAKYQPKAILCLGDIPLRELTGYSGITSYRGFLLPTSYNIPAIGCVDPTTECLTVEGWKSYEQLQVGGLVAAQGEDGLLRWEPLQAVHVYPDVSTEMLSVQGQCLDMFVSPEHRCVIRQPISRKKFRRNIKRATELRKSHAIPLAADWDECDMSSFGSLEIAELLGWYISEGSPHGSGVRIYQSRSANPQHCARIETLLRAVDAEYSVGESRPDELVFGVYGAVGKFLRNLAPDKQFPAGFLKWGRPLLLAFYKGLVDGDGSKDSETANSWHQSNAKRLDDFQALVTRLGWASSLKKQAADKEPGNRTIDVYKHPKSKWRGLGVNRSKITKEWQSYRGTIWCPQTPSSTWVARRNGKVFITGNSYHPAYLIRGAMHLFGAFLSDLNLAVHVAKHGAPEQKETNYALNPTDDDIRNFLDSIRSRPEQPVAYDLETAAILGDTKPEGTDDDAIIQIQFSNSVGTAIVLAWDSRGIDAAREILALPNPKWGWNDRLFDRPLLARNGISIGGEQHDLMYVWQHLQPSYGSGRDDTNADKGVPSRLMGLQSCASFYCPEVGPWKGMVERAINQSDGDGSDVGAALRYYGALDADITYRCGVGLFRSLTTAGLERGYREHKYELCRALDVISAHGLPINRQKQGELRAFTIAELSRMSGELQAAIPAELRDVHPKGGFKVLSAKYRKLLEGYDPANPPFVELKSVAGWLVQRKFGEEARWCLEKPFNPNSSVQLIRYLRHQGYPIPTKVDDPGKETTGKNELEKLAAKVNDPALNLVVASRELRKTGMDYTGGKWEPGSDGRVHPTFKPNAASGQLTANSPNVQQFPEHSPLAKRAKEMIAAESGHTLVKIDARGYHSRVIGWLANDPAYYKLADYDVHSFATAHYLRLQGADYLLELPDDELREELAIIKRMHKHTRDFKIKRCVHGAQFGLGVRKLYRMNSDHFENEAEARQMISMLQRLFPATFVKFPKWVYNQIHTVTRGRLVNPFGMHRYFFDYDMEQATAYLPSSCAHAMFQKSKVRLFKAGALEKYGCCNTVHDSLWLHCPTPLVDECIDVVTAELVKPSDVLKDSPLGPFSCNWDTEIGPSLAEMKPYA